MSNYDIELFCRQFHSRRLDLVHTLYMRVIQPIWVIVVLSSVLTPFFQNSEHDKDILRKSLDMENVHNFWSIHFIGDAYEMRVVSEGMRP